MEDRKAKTSWRESKLGLLPPQVIKVVYLNTPKHTTFSPVFMRSIGQNGIPGILTLLKASDSISNGLYCATQTAGLSTRPQKFWSTRYTRYTTLLLGIPLHPNKGDFVEEIPSI